MNRLYYISATVILLFFMSHSHLHSLSLSHLLTRLYRFTYFLNYTSKLWFWRILFFFFALLLKYFKCVLATSNTIRLSLENDILMFYRKRDNSFFNIIFEKGKEWRIYIYIAWVLLVLQYHSNPFLYYHNRIRFLLFTFDETFVYVNWLLFWPFVATYFFPKIALTTNIYYNIK